MINKFATGISLSIAVLTLPSCASIQGGATYTPAQLRSMVQNGNYPKQGSPSTKSERIGYSACVEKIESVVASVSTNYPSRTIVNTKIMRMEKLWTNDAAMTFTCSAADNKLVITSAQYQ